MNLKVAEELESLHGITVRYTDHEFPIYAWLRDPKRDADAVCYVQL